jgi:hypothetical protein
LRTLETESTDGRLSEWDAKELLDTREDFCKKRVSRVQEEREKEGRDALPWYVPVLQVTVDPMARRERRFSRPAALHSVKSTTRTRRTKREKAERIARRCEGRSDWGE